jgi:predicted  nucleic acid-binding Zn-ribbon protein
MKTKFLSAVLLGGFLATSAGTFVSCKDYDDDITDLQSQIDALSKSSTDALSSKASELASQISSLTAAQTTLQQSLDAAKSDADTKVAAAQAAADAAKTSASNAQGSADAAQSAADAAQSTANAAQSAADAAQGSADAAQATADQALAAAQDALARVAVLEAQIEKVNEAIEALTQKDAEIEAQIAEAKQAVADNKADADAKIVAANQAVDAAKAEVEGELEVLQSTVNAEIAKLNKQIAASDDQSAQKLTAISDDLTSLSKKLEQDLASLEAAYKADDEVIKGDVTKNSEAIATLQADLAKANAALELQEKALANYESQLTALGTLVDGNATDIAQLNKDLSDLKDTVAGQQATWEAYVQKALAEAGVATDASVQGLSDRIAALEESLANYLTTADYEAYKAELDTRLAGIESAATDVNGKLDVLSALFAKRLTSLVFAPSTYINGIESIEFSSLKYTAWKETAIAKYLDRAAALTTNDVTIGKDEAQATYYYSPSNAAIDIDKLSLNFRSATNLVTRAAAEPVAISKIVEAQNGKLVLALKKNSTDNLQGTLASATNQKESFTILSLTSQIELTDEEVAAGVSPYVSSDWARLYETAITPYIHQKSIKDCGNQDESDEDGNAPEFYSFETIHSNGGARVETDKICDTDGKYIVKEQVYNEPLDLSTLVTVCDLNNQKLDNYADYGLAFEFNLVPYKLLSNVEEETDQADFATISGSTITSHAQKLPDLINNRDAIGREPLIQAVLKDTENGNIVDIRYFKIKWVATTPTTMSVEFDTLKEKDPYTCGDAYEEYILTDEMNQKIYARVNNEQGIAKTDFHNQYTLDTNLYLNKEDATKGENATTDYGTIEEIVADGSTVTYNLKWTITPSDKVFDGIEGYTKAEYEAGTATRTVYGRYTLNGSSEGMIIFKLSLSFDIAKMSTIGYRGTQWDTTDLKASNASKGLNVNPALTSDANYGTAASFTDCQLITDLLFGYYYTNSDNKNVSPSEITEIVKNLGEGDNVDVQFIFDSSRLSILPDNGAGWSVSADGKTLIKTTNGVEEKAAVITDKNEIQLYEEGTPGVSGEPTDAARSLLSKQVPVKLNATNCAGINADLDKFLVRFVEPLEIVINNGDLELYDWTTGGDPASIEGVYTVQERFWGSNEPRKVVYYDADKDELVKDDELVAWYIVEDLNWDFENAKTNLKFDGTNLVISNKIDQDWSAYSEDYNLTLGILDKETGDLTISDKTNDPDANVIVFQNQSGNSIQQEFKVSVPVTLPTKWNSPSMTKYVTVTIKSGHEKE